MKRQRPVTTYALSRMGERIKGNPHGSRRAYFYTGFSGKTLNLFPEFPAHGTPLCHGICQARVAGRCSISLHAVDVGDVCVPVIRQQLEELRRTALPVLKRAFEQYSEERAYYEDHDDELHELDALARALME